MSSDEEFQNPDGSSDDEIDRDKENEKDNTKELMVFVDLLDKYKVLLNKSQIPEIKKAKGLAKIAFAKEYHERLNKELPEKTLFKTIQNLKQRVKVKTDKKRTGNKKIILLPHETKMHQLMNPDPEGNPNPSLEKVPGAISSFIVTASSVESQESIGASTSSSHQNPAAKKSPIPPPPTANKKRKISQDLLKAQETDETVGLSIQELNRLVLLEQIKLMRLKRARLEAQSVIVINTDEQGLLETYDNTGNSN